MEWKSESVTATVPKLVGNCSSCPDGGAITTTIRPSFSDTKFFFHLTPFFLDTVGPDKFIRTNVFTWIDFESVFLLLLLQHLNSQHQVGYIIYQDQKSYFCEFLMFHKVLKNYRFSNLHL